MPSIDPQIILVVLVALGVLFGIPTTVYTVRTIQEKKRKKALAEEHEQQLCSLGADMGWNSLTGSQSGD